MEKAHCKNIVLILLFAVCVFVIWQELKDSNPHEQFWRLSCYRLHQAPMGWMTEIESATFGATIQRSKPSELHPHGDAYGT